MRSQVLITGAYGLIGNIVYRHLSGQPERYDVYALSRRRRTSARIPESQAAEIPDARLRLADLSDLEAIQRAVEGIDVVVHMAADADARHGWETMLPSNVIGAYNLLEACRQAGVKRVVAASTIQVVFGYVAEEPYRTLFYGSRAGVPDDFPLITHTSPPRPLNLYAASKIWGEALAHTYAATHHMSVLNLRIGWVVSEDRLPQIEAISVWSSQRDIAQLAQRCIDAPESVRFDIFYGVSRSPYRWVDIEHAREVVGYVPQDEVPT
jgi:nucleoside-diphosphate-sugar epimerase